MNTSSVKLTFERFNDTYGRPICAWNFDAGQVCTFLGTSGMCGKDEVCLFPNPDGPTKVFRRSKVFLDNPSVGFIEIHNKCPLWRSTHAIPCVVSYSVFSVIKGEIISDNIRNFPSIRQAVDFITSNDHDTFKYVNVEYKEYPLS